MKRFLSISLLAMVTVLAGFPATTSGREIKARGRVHALRAFELRVPPGDVLASVHVGTGELVEAGDTLVVKESVDLQIRLNDLRDRAVELQRGLPTEAEAEVRRTRRDREFQRQLQALQALRQTSSDPQEITEIEGEIELLALAQTAAVQRERRDRELLDRQLELLAAAENLVLEKIAGCAVLSPVSGTVTAMTCQAGAQSGDGGLLVVRSLDAMEVRCEVPQNAVRFVAVGQPATLTPDFMDDVQLTGQVVKTGLQGRINDEGFVFFPVVVSIDGGTGPLIPGMTVSVTIEAGSP